jgi:PAS domain S-box-containing protein
LAFYETITLNMSTNLAVVNALVDSAGREMYVGSFFNSYRSQQNIQTLITLCDFSGKLLISNQNRENLHSHSTDAAILNSVITKQQAVSIFHTEGNETSLIVFYPVFYAATGMAEGLLSLEISVSQLLSTLMPDLLLDKEYLFSFSSEKKELWTSQQGNFHNTLSNSVDIKLPAPLDQLDLVVTAYQDPTRTYASLSVLSWIYFIIGAIVLLLVTVGSKIMGRKLTAPLLSLTEQANQIAWDDFNQSPIQANEKDETKLLSTAFDTMFQRISEARESLETKIDERTLELSRTTQTLNMILENTPIAIFNIFDKQLVWMNQKAIVTFQYSKEEYELQSIRQLYPSEEAYKKFIEDAHPILSQGLVFDSEQELVRKDGAHILTRCIGKALYPADLQQGTIWLVEDITERKQSEKLLLESEKKFRTITNYTYAWEIWESPTGGYYYSSPSCERITGYSADSFVTDSGLLKRLIHPKDLQTWKEHHNSAHSASELQPGAISVNELDFRIIHSNGEVRWIGHTCHCIHDVDGNFLGHRISNRDITDRKNAEKALLLSEENLKQAQEVAEIGSWHLDIGANKLTWSEETYQLFGIKPEQQINSDVFFSIIHPEDREKLKAAWDNALTGNLYDIEHRIVVDEKIMWIRERALIQRDSEGRPLYGIGTAQNVTERKVAEDKLRSFAEMQSVLLREVNHRVKNNLLAIISMLHHEEDRAEEKGLEEHQNRIQEVVWRVAGLLTVHRLLSSSAWKPLLLSQLCESIIKETTKSLPAAQSLQLVVTPSEARVDSDQAHALAIVLNELSTNTMKYASKNREVTRIAISIEQNDTHITLTFQDDGPGLPNNLLQGNFSNGGIGMTLMNGLVRRNLRGDLILTNNNGAIASITFPATTSDASITITHKENQT